MKERYLSIEARQGNKQKPPPKIQGTQFKWREQKQMPKRINERKK